MQIQVTTDMTGASDSRVMSLAPINPVHAFITVMAMEPGDELTFKNGVTGETVNYKIISLD